MNTKKVLENKPLGNNVFCRNKWGLAVKRDEALGVKLKQDRIE